MKRRLIIRLIYDAARGAWTGLLWLGGLSLVLLMLPLLVIVWLYARLIDSPEADWIE